MQPPLPERMTQQKALHPVDAEHWLLQGANRWSMSLLHEQKNFLFQLDDIKGLRKALAYAKL